MLKEEMDKRAKKFAIQIIKLCKFLPETRQGILFENQLFRSSVALAAHYRSACRARSTKDFAEKLITVEESADQNLFWLEMIVELELIRPELVKPLIEENEAIIKIIHKTIHSL